MKKKILILLVALAMIVAATAGCTDDEEELAAMKADTQQETVEVVGIGQIEEELDLKIILPATVTDESCSIIEGRIGVISFVLNEKPYTYYVEAAEAEADATGMAAGLANVETVLVDNNTYQLGYETEGIGISYWYDKTNKIACTLLMTEGATAEGLKSMTESILSVQI